MEKYRCRICGYVYDPNLGDADGNIKVGTAFTALPDSWLCPICGATKAEFDKLDEMV
jgi:rubredoxin